MSETDASVLVLEDNDSLQTLYNLWLGGFVAELNIVERGDAFLNEMDESYDIAILDLHVPGTSGTHLLDELENINPDVKLVVVSGDLESEEDERVQREFITDKVVKPVEEEDIVRVVERLTSTPA